MTPCLDVTFITEEAKFCNNGETIDAISEKTIGAIMALRKPSCFIISCFTVSVPHSVYRPEPSSDFTIFVMPSIFSFEKDAVISFPALTAPSHLVFFQIYLI